MYAASLSHQDVGAAKASLNRAIELHALDPKLNELTMARLKVG